MASSRYSITRVIKDPSQFEPQHYATYDFPESIQGIQVEDLLTGQTFTQYVWQQGDRLDKLSQRFLGDDDYWWMIALVNGINFGLGITPGTVLRIPSDVDAVLALLGIT
jgi:nucleoid-associated protein YgaU